MESCRDSNYSNTFALHVTDPELILDTPYCSLSPSRNKLRALSQEQVLSIASDDQNQKPNLKEKEKKVKQRNLQPFPMCTCCRGRLAKRPFFLQEYGNRMAARKMLVLSRKRKGLLVVPTGQKPGAPEEGYLPCFSFTHQKGPAAGSMIPSFSSPESSYSYHLCHKPCQFLFLEGPVHF